MKWNVFKKNFVFFLNKNVFIDAEFVSLLERVSKLTFWNAFFNENIFFRNHKNERNENRHEQNKNKYEQNENEIEQNKNERRISKKKSNRQKFEFWKFSNCAKKTNAKKISKHFHFKFIKFEKKIDSKIFAQSFVDENEITIRFFFVKQFSKKNFFSKTKRTEISTSTKFRRKKK